MVNNGKRQTTRGIVEDIFVQHPHWNATQVFNEYQRIQPKDRQITHISTIQRHLESVREKYRDLVEKGLDAPWSMGSYAYSGFEVEQYKLTAEDNLAILAVRKKQLHTDKMSERMSTRQALWIARLRAIVDSLHLEETPEGREYWLWMYSFQYAIREKVAKLRGEVFNSRELDNALADGHGEFKRVYKKSVYANWKDYEPFYRSHYLDGETEYKAVKDGDK